ncbi:HlyC/CorC family transporter [Ornithobacterium rhinotracheale]|uniref:hemolysin family protein n=1 Tax=Ornithobacterium rhinotracheale TaxID=28251 RepID=UPI00129CBC18|nr:hemolysin family protein [Ornithobacterium rhinotracheale]MRI63740.1 HlyC/CorC family transporter [Ornithobacterium rhinotracheale]MRJ07340.1 HlyC/CorC family transporter [Ornithobacterium rhinotracheale]MRJ09642.1 HlyC/CorC family transporter [Ornithobacterium rhinotracheale]UOH77941.1 hemolysin family protein [Ornithobacterium rhinotracheale]
MSATIPIIIIAILASAFFSGTEIAFISLSRMQLELEAKKENWISRKMLYLAGNPKKFIATMLVGNNISLVIYGIFMGQLIVKYLPSYSPTIDVLIQTLISTVVILATAEFLPKAIFSIYPNRLFKTFVLPAWLIYILFTPLTTFIMWISDLFLKLVGQEQTEDEIFLKDELKYFISEQLVEADDDEIDTEVQIFHNALEFSEIKVRECMVPRKEIVAVKIDEPIEEVRKKFIETGFSKIIVYQENIDNIIGYIHSFDLFKKPKNIRNTMLPVDFVNETSLAKDVMDDLIKKRKSVAIVLDEYGGTAGMLTVEDVVEELFGEIEDEHDKVKLIEEKVNENEFLFSARVEIDYLNQEYGWDLPESEAYETLGGLAVSELEKIPEIGETFVIDNKYKFEIIKGNDIKIEEIKITLIQD